MKSVVRPRDAVQWTLYYPPLMVFDPEDYQGVLPEAEQFRLTRSLAAHGRSGLIDELGDGIADIRFLGYRAGLSLTVGRVEKALAGIGKVLELDAGNSEALALRSIIAVVQNRKYAAVMDARRAVASRPDSPTALIALSY